MSDKRMVIVDDRLINKIDECRGLKSRSEFIDSCVHTLFKETETVEKAPVQSTAGPEPLVSREEFEQFRGRIDNLNQQFMDFFIKYAGNLAADKPSVPDTQAFTKELRRLLTL